MKTKKPLVAEIQLVIGEMLLLQNLYFTAKLYYSI